MFRWIIRAVIVGCLFGLALGAGMSIKQLVGANSVFNVSAVEVRGVYSTDKKRLEKIFTPLIGQNIFTEIIPGTFLADDPWIVKLEMKRVIPDKLMVFVEEEKEVFSYKRGGKCYALTERNSKIPVKCEGVRINVIEAPLILSLVSLLSCIRRMIC